MTHTGESAATARWARHAAKAFNRKTSASPQNGQINTRDQARFTARWALRAAKALVKQGLLALTAIFSSQSRNKR